MILKEEYYEELLENIRNTPDFVFMIRMLRKDEILKDDKLLEKMWTEYQDQIEMDVDENYAYAFMLEKILNIPLSRWQAEFEKCIDHPHNDIYR